VGRPSNAVLAGVLALGVIAVSTSGLIVRAAFNSAGGGSLGRGLLLAMTRLAFAAALTAPAWMRRRSSHRAHRATDPRPGPLAPGTRRRLVWAGVLLGLHFGAWLPSLAFTSIAASTTIVTTGPVWVALLEWGFRGRRPTALASAGITVAIVGGALVSVGRVSGLGSGSNPLLGNFLALVAAVAYAGHLLLGESVQRRGLGLWRWTAVVAAIGAATILPIVGVTGPGDGPLTIGFWAAALALALGPQLVGHSSFTWSVRWLSPTMVSVTILLEPVLTTIGAIALYDEVPGGLVVVGAVVLIAGVAVTIVAEQERQPLPATGPIGPT
jgi:drug/metabolite transporter (DMT)-like permease